VSFPPPPPPLLSDANIKSVAFITVDLVLLNLSGDSRPESRRSVPGALLKKTVSIPPGN